MDLSDRIQAGDLPVGRPGRKGRAAVRTSPPGRDGDCWGGAIRCVEERVQRLAWPVERVVLRLPILWAIPGGLGATPHRKAGLRLPLSKLGRPHHAAPPTPPLMSDLIYLAVIVVFFAAAELYARGCEKL